MLGRLLQVFASGKKRHTCAVHDHCSLTRLRLLLSLGGGRRFTLFAVRTGVLAPVATPACRVALSPALLSAYLLPPASPRTLRLLQRWVHNDSNYRKSKHLSLPPSLPPPLPFSLPPIISTGLVTERLLLTFRSPPAYPRGGGGRRRGGREGRGGEGPPSVVMAATVHCGGCAGLPPHSHSRARPRDLLPLLPAAHALCRRGRQGSEWSNCCHLLWPFITVERKS